MTTKEQLRALTCHGREIQYILERKSVKNLNMRIRPDGAVKVSANQRMPMGEIDRFVASKCDFIWAVQERFEKIRESAPPVKQYISGESITILGRQLSLEVLEGTREGVSSDGVNVYLTVKDTEDIQKKERLIRRYLDSICRELFAEMAERIYPVFKSWGVEMPSIKIRSMTTRWGSCSPSRGNITLNTRLVEFPRRCTEYVVLHEFCHLVHPNHSKAFYGLVSELMPDWQERRAQLNKSVAVAADII